MDIQGKLLPRVSNPDCDSLISSPASVSKLVNPKPGPSRLPETARCRCFAAPRSPRGLVSDPDAVGEVLLAQDKGGPRKGGFLNKQLF